MTSLGGGSELILDPWFLGEIFLELNIEYVSAIRLGLFHFSAYWNSIRKGIGFGQKMRFLMEASQTYSDRFFIRLRRF